MKNKQAAFTLVEMLIVIAMMTVLTGFLSKMWYKMEYTSRASNRSLTFTAKSQMIVDRLTKDIHSSVSVTQSDSTLLTLSQVSSTGEKREIIYRMDGDDLIRSERTGEIEKKSSKILSLDNSQLNISVSDNDTVRVEIRRDGRNRPLEMQARHLVSFARPYGGKR
ncbi:MAG: prepilin-type N-terminal cleavage/methylation domain-containing protein [bacterium]